ncbi:MAG: hypothetical protein V3U16_05515 [Candidatus Neomarinimicrobiota bacterium]
MNTKQLSIILIAGGVLVFVLVFIGKIIEFVFRHQVLGLALIAILIGVLLMGYNIYIENKKDAQSE